VLFIFSVSDQRWALDCLHSDFICLGWGINSTRSLNIAGWNGFTFTASDWSWTTMNMSAGTCTFQMRVASTTPLAVASQLTSFSACCIATRALFSSTNTPTSLYCTGFPSSVIYFLWSCCRRSCWCWCSSLVELSTVGDRAFPTAAARTWNSLPTWSDCIKFPANLQNQTKITFILGVVSIVSKLL